MFGLRNFPLFLGFAICVSCSNGKSDDDRIITIATTTSTQASGLLDILLPGFTKDTGIKVKVLAKGTGAAMRDGMDGNVDLVFVHAKSREEQFVKDGLGTRRYGVMHNDFLIVGPPDDPASIKGLKSAPKAFEKIAQTNSPFVSRGDDSGTHTKEQAIWKKTNLPLNVKDEGPSLEGKWYFSLGQGMGKSLTYADEKQTYILTDRGTYLKYKYGRTPPIALIPLCQGDPMLNNPYGVIPVNPGKHPHVKHEMAKQFATWLVSKKAQDIIENYKLHGRQLFYPDAISHRP